MIVTEVQTEAAAIRAAVDGIDDEGRRMGVYPDMMRDLFEMHRLR